MARTIRYESVAWMTSEWVVVVIEPASDNYRLRLRTETSREAWLQSPSDNATAWQRKYYCPPTRAQISYLRGKAGSPQRAEEAGETRMTFLPSCLHYYPWWMLASSLAYSRDLSNSKSNYKNVHVYIFVCERLELGTDLSHSYTLLLQICFSFQSHKGYPKARQTKGGCNERGTRSGPARHNRIFSRPRLLIKTRVQPQQQRASKWTKPCPCACGIVDVHK